MKKQYLGIYDSGIGGLTVVKAIQEALPQENIVFLADSKNMPYGSKSKEEIVSFSLKNAEILNRYNLKAIVIACNTSDSIAKNELKKHYSLPIIGVIDSAVKQALLQSKNKKIAVLATEATTASKSYVNAITEHDEQAEVFSVACPELVPLIEKGYFKNDDGTLENSLRQYLKDAIDNNADTVILGCTHYDVLIEMVKKIMPEVNVVSSSRCIVEDIKEKLDCNTDEEESETVYLASSDSSTFKQVANEIIPGINIETVN